MNVCHHTTAAVATFTSAPACSPFTAVGFVLLVFNVCVSYCRAAAIHGDMDQSSRMAVLSEFKAGRHHVLVATDVAARGLDIK